MSLIERIIGALAPHECLGCGHEGGLLCPVCLQKLPPAKVPLPPGSQLSQVQAVTLYEGVAKDLIWKLKSGGAQAAAQIMAKQLAALVPAGPGALIVPIPTATLRVRQRGYDQARLLARSLARQTGLTYRSCLARYGQAHQVGAHRNQRLKQLRGALRVTKSVQDLHIILVDDVTTTGATLETAAKILKRAGAARVEAITFAYAPLTGTTNE